MQCKVRKVTIQFTTHVSYPIDREYTSDMLPDFDAIAEKRMKADDGDGDWDVWTEDAGYDEVDSIEDLDIK
jgi:hypothetical protein